MRKSITLTIWLALGGFPTLAQTTSGPTGAAGSGPYAVPNSAAYSILENAAHKIVTDNSLTSQPIIIYDPATFGLIATYQTAVQHLQKTMTEMCAPVAEGPRPLIALGPVDIGTAASGLAALLTAVTPSYAIQGQALPFDNSALIAAFAQQAGTTVVFPGYLLPAAKEHDVACGAEMNTRSLVDLWYGGAAQAANLQQQIAVITGTSQADKDKKAALQSKLDAYSKVAETYLAVDKGSSLLSKLLVVQSLVKLAEGGGVKVIDLKLDAVGMESVTRTVLGFKKTKFACNVAAHYTLLQFKATPDSISLAVSKTDLVNILLKVANEDKFGSTVTPIETINGTHSDVPLKSH